jgi:hypothetical protein
MASKLAGQHQSEADRTAAASLVTVRGPTPMFAAAGGERPRRR